MRGVECEVRWIQNLLHDAGGGGGSGVVLKWRWSERSGMRGGYKHLCTCDDVLEGEMNVELLMSGGNDR